jgi:hypothetical protein
MIDVIASVGFRIAAIAQHKRVLIAARICQSDIEDSSPAT